MKNRIIVFLASGLGLGFFPVAPGTIGTLLGLALAVFLPDRLLLVSGMAVLGIWLAHEAEKILKEHDSPKIVVDEIAGMLIAAYHWHGFNLILAFILFRLLDIAKPFPIRQLQKLPGGLGVMSDDLAAGLAANVILYLAYQVYLGLV